MTFPLLYIAVGLFAGFLAGLLGVGGGLVIVPVLTFIFAAQHFPEAHILHFALGTSLASIIFTSVFSVCAHHAHGAVNWGVMRTITPGVVTGTLLGTWLAAGLSTVFLKIFFVLFVFYAGTQMLARVETLTAMGFVQLLEQNQLLPLSCESSVWAANVFNQSFDGCLVRIDIRSLHRAR